MIVVDTHVLIWYLDDPRQLSRRARARVDAAAAAQAIYVSSISIWEIAMLVQRGRLKLTMELREWLTRVESLSFLRSVPVDNEIALRSVQLTPALHPDPADRIIVATAQDLDLDLVTKDSRLRGYPAVRTVW